MKKITVHFDGACEPFNPGGNMGWGVTIFDDNESRFIYQGSGYSPKSDKNTNNVAEYLALISGLEWLIEKELTGEQIRIFGDSMLVIRQMAGDWSAKKGLYVPYYYRAKKLLVRFSNIAFAWVPREKNALADSLSKARILS